jgi:hypothetical protein
MPLTPEMYILDREVSRNQQFVTGGQTQHRAVVPDPGYDRNPAANSPPDLLD